MKRVQCAWCTADISATSKEKHTKDCFIYGPQAKPLPLPQMKKAPE